MQNEYLILLFKVIDSNSNLDSLLSVGLKYSQITHYISWMIENDYVNNDKKLVITEKGKKFKEELIKKYSKSGIFIMPSKNVEVKKIGKYDICLPKRIKLQ